MLIAGVVTRPFDDIQNATIFSDMVTAYDHTSSDSYYVLLEIVVNIIYHTS